MSLNSVGFWLWAWQPPQSLRISPGRSWCQVWAMFSTMPFLSSVWKVQATSAGILARKLVSGLPSGSSRLLARPCELAHRDLAEDAQAFVGVVVEAAGRPAAASVSAPGPGCGWRGCRCCSYRPASAPWHAPVAGARTLIAEGGHTGSPTWRSRSPLATTPCGNDLALVQAGRADQAERRPFRQVRRRLPSLRSGGRRAGSSTP